MAPKNKSKPPSKPTTSTTTITSSSPPNWPSLHPPLPSDQQSLTSLLPSQILTTQLLTSRTTSLYRTFLSTLPLTTTPGPKRGEALRVNDRYQTTDPTFASNLWTSTGLETLVRNGDIDNNPLTDDERRTLFGGEILGLSDNIRIYRYSEGQFFGAHYDDSNNITFMDGDTKVQGRTTWTLLIYLSGPETGCEGGETVFYPTGARGRRLEEVVAAPRAGMALLHRHGRECMLHEGREVRKGEKWIIRSDLVVKR